MEAAKELWNAYVADPNVLLWSNITLVAVAIFLLVFLAWEVIKPPRVHGPVEEPRWQALRVTLALAVMGVSGAFVLAGLLENDRVGTSVRALTKNATIAFLLLVLLLQAIMRRADAYKRRLRERK